MRVRPGAPQSYAGLAALIGAGALVLPVAAQAQGPAVSSAAEEIAALEAQLARDAVQLSSGCATACPALASMERAAARICALDPGPRCADARARVREAAQRVGGACDCKATERLHREEKEPAPEKPAAPPQEKAPAPPPPPSPAPAAEHVLAAPRHGGCAGCAVAGDDPRLLGPGLLVAAGLAGQALRRRSRRRAGYPPRRGGVTKPAPWPPVPGPSSSPRSPR